MNIIGSNQKQQYQPLSPGAMNPRASEDSAIAQAQSPWQGLATVPNSAGWGNLNKHNIKTARERELRPDTATLRDQFAIAAMPLVNACTDFDLEEAAKKAYEIADAMMRARGL